MQILADMATAGILLSPAVDHALDYHYTLPGHHVRIASVDLNLPWRDIHAGLANVFAEARV